MGIPRACWSIAKRAKSSSRDESAWVPCPARPNPEATIGCVTCCPNEIGVAAGDATGVATGICNATRSDDTACALSGNAHWLQKFTNADPKRPQFGQRTTLDALLPEICNPPLPRRAALGKREAAVPSGVSTRAPESSCGDAAACGPGEAASSAPATSCVEAAVSSTGAFTESAMAPSASPTLAAGDARDGVSPVAGDACGGVRFLRGIRSQSSQSSTEGDPNKPSRLQRGWSEGTGKNFPACSQRTPMLTWSQRQCPLSASKRSLLVVFLSLEQPLRRF